MILESNDIKRIMETCYLPYKTAQKPDMILHFLNKRNPPICVGDWITPLHHPGAPSDHSWFGELMLVKDIGYGEIIVGGQREDDYDTLKNKINSHGLSEKHLKWYLDLRKYGSVPHGGFGLGIERTLAWICGLKHVRETIPFPRLLGRIEIKNL